MTSIPSLKKNSLTGDIIIESDTFGTIVGFENHGGRTYHPYGTLGRVTYGYGNNDNDRKEVYTIKIY